jgi:hypothetical protein
MKGQAFILAAQQALENGSGAPRSRLAAAAPLLWKAMYYEETWPEDLRTRAAQLARRLLAGGPIERTVQNLAPAEVDSLLSDLSRFVESFRLRGGNPAGCSEG